MSWKPFLRRYSTLSFLAVPARVALILSCLLVVVIGCSKRPPPLPPSAGGTSPSASGDSTDTSTGAHLAPELDLRIEPPSIRPGQSALLTWESRNAQSVTIEPAIGAVDLSGRIKFFPDQTSTYSVRADGPGGTVSKSVTVRVATDESGAGTIDEQDIRNLPIEEQFQLRVKPVFFGFDSSELSEEATLTLDGNARWLLRPEASDLKIVLEGHADERGSEEYNLALGDKRALVVYEYLVTKGLDASRMIPVSLGEERPFDRRSTEEAYALNRRAEFRLLQEEP